MSDHNCYKILPKPRWRHRYQVRVCGCGNAFACWKIGILAPAWRWVRWRQ